MANIYLGIVTHLVYGFCVEIAFSSSSSALDFFNFFTRLLTAFSDHFPSIDESSLPFFQANNRFTIGGVNGNIFDNDQCRLITIFCVCVFEFLINRKPKKKIVFFFRFSCLSGETQTFVSLCTLSFRCYCYKFLCCILRTGFRSITNKNRVELNSTF